MRLGVGVFALLALSCAHRSSYQQTATKDETARWQTVESAVETKQSTEQKTEKTTGRRRVTTYRPSGEVIVDESFSETLSALVASSGVVSSASTTTKAETNTSVRSSTVKMTESKPSGFSLPWWAYVGALGVLLFFAGRLLWKAGWRPWKRN